LPPPAPPQRRRRRRLGRWQCSLRRLHAINNIHSAHNYIHPSHRRQAPCPAVGSRPCRPGCAPLVRPGGGQQMALCIVAPARLRLPAWILLGSATTQQWFGGSQASSWSLHINRPPSCSDALACIGMAACSSLNYSTLCRRLPLISQMTRWMKCGSASASTASGAWGLPSEGQYAGPKLPTWHSTELLRLASSQRPQSLCWCPLRHYPPSRNAHWFANNAWGVSLLFLPGP